jgi:hypothetical protein
MPEAENQQVVVWCAGCKAEVAHWRVNAALRICTKCGEEIHEAEVIMAKHFTDAERAGIQLQLANGAKVKDLAKEMGRSYHTIVSIQRAMPKGLKGKKLLAALQAAVDKHALKGPGSISPPEGLPRGVDLSAAVDPGPSPRRGGGVIIRGVTSSDVEALACRQWIVSLINRRLDAIRAELLGLVE